MKLDDELLALFDEDLEASATGSDQNNLQPRRMPSAENSRCGFISLIGAPNAGKSTLLNRMVGHKVSIVSRKVQTTRSQIKGIAIHEDSQIVFIDTPGIFSPKRRLDRAMVHAAWTGAADADKVVLLIDARKGICDDVQRIIEALNQKSRKVVIALNKVDGFNGEKLLILTEKLQSLLNIEQLFMISALKGQGVDRLKDYLASHLPKSPWLYPDDQLTDMPLKLLAAETTREQIFDRLHEELPYQMTVETEKVTQMKDGSIRLDQTIYVTKDSQKQIVLGKGGDQIRQISMKSRGQLSRLLEKTVHLFIFVKVRENWQDDPDRYMPWGLTFKV